MTNQKTNDKLSYVNRLIGKRMYVLEKGYGWFGEVIKVVDEENVIIQDGDLKMQVEIHNLRDPNFT